MATWRLLALLFITLATVCGSALAQGRPTEEGGTPPPKEDPGVTARGGPEEPVSDGNAESEADRLRRREEITYRPTLDVESDYDCRMVGTMEALLVGAEPVNGKATILKKAVEYLDDGTVRVAYKIMDGLCDIGLKQKSVGEADAILFADFDARHQMIKVEKAVPDERSVDEKKDKLDLGAIILYILTSVAYHERSVGEGTEWPSEYEVIDAYGRTIKMTGEHELVSFLLEGDRRVAVIHSLLTIPVSGKAGDFDIAGDLDCDVISEVYVDTGEIRYRRAACEGKLKGAIVALKIPYLETWLRLLDESGAPVVSLYEPDAIPQIAPPEWRSSEEPVEEEHSAPHIAPRYPTRHDP